MWKRSGGSETNVTAAQKLLRAVIAEDLITGPPTLDFMEEFF